MKQANFVQRVQSQLTAYDNLAYTSALGSYQVDLIMSIGLAFMCASFLLFQQLLSTKIVQENSFIVFSIIGYSIYLLKYYVSFLLTRKQYTANQILQNDQQTKPLGLCLFICNWLALFSQNFMFDIGIIGIYFYFALQYVLDKINIQFPHNFRGSRAVVMAIVGMTLVRKILRPADFELQGSSALGILVTYQLAAALCLLFSYQESIRPKSKDELIMFCYFYFQHCELIYLCVLPLYKTPPPLTILIIFLLNAYILWQKIQLKPYILLVKFIQNNEGAIFKLNNNYAVESAYQWHTSKTFKAYRRIFRHLTFNDEYCCMCDHKKAIVVGKECGHVLYCRECAIRQIYKMSSVQYELFCPLCKSVCRQLFVLGQYSSQELVERILERRMKVEYLHNRYAYVKVNRL